MPDKVQIALRAIIEAVDKIEQYVAGHTDADSFYRDSKSFDAALMNFIVIGEMIDRIPTDYKNMETSVDWKSAKGFRNINAHDYFGIDADEMWDIIKNKLPAFKTAIKKLADRDVGGK